MQTRINEISDGIYRLSTLVPEVAPPAGFAFNQFLVMADEPLLFHCGHKAMFENVRAAVERLMPVEKLRWISFSHLEADESGAMNLWQQAAPHAQVAHGQLGCDISLNDLSLRTPRALADNEVFDLGGRRIRYLATPHVPHGWDAGLMYEEVTGTLLCSDLLGQVGDGPAIAAGDIVGPAPRVRGALSLDERYAGADRHTASPGRARAENARDHARLVAQRKLSGRAGSICRRHRAPGPAGRRLRRGPVSAEGPCLRCAHGRIGRAPARNAQALRGACAGTARARSIRVPSGANGRRRHARSRRARRPVRG